MNSDLYIERTSTSPSVSIQSRDVRSTVFRQFTVSFLNKICKSTYYLIFIGLLIYFLLNNHSIISIKESNNSSLLSSPRNSTRRKPTLAIVMTLTPNLIQESVARISVANKRNYARKHGYEVLLDIAIDRSRNPAWSKIITLHSAMHTRPDIQWFWWLDMDAFILEKQIDIYDQVIEKYQWAWDNGQNITKDLLISNDCDHMDSFNAGSFLIRNTAWSKQAMRTVYEDQYWQRHYSNEEQDTMFWLYKNDISWTRQVQIFPMRLANSFPPPSCGQIHRSKYEEGDMVVHYAGVRKQLFGRWPTELQQWRSKGKLLDDLEVDVFL